MFQVKMKVEIVFGAKNLKLICSSKHITILPSESNLFKSKSKRQIFILRSNRISVQSNISNESSLSC